MTMNQNDINYHITYQYVNGDNWGSSFANKEFHICWSVVEIDIIKTKMKKIIGCFINTNDLLLEENKNEMIDKHIYFFQSYLKLDQLFNLKELLPNTIYSKNYSNTITKKHLFESSDVTIKKIISKCETVLKEKVLMS